MVDFSSMTIKASEAGSVTFGACSGDEFEQTLRLVAVCLYVWWIYYTHEGEVSSELVRVAHDLAVNADDFERIVRSKFDKYNE